MSIQAPKGIQNQRIDLRDRRKACLMSMNDLRRDRMLCDVNIKIENGNLWAHKIVLASSSEYFNAMFLRSFRESNEVEICIKGGTSFQTFELLIDFLYTSTVTITECNVQDLLVASNLFLINDLSEACRSFIKNNITVDNVLQVQELAEFQNDRMLYSKCSAYVFNNFAKFARSRNFLLLSFEQITKLLQHDELHADHDQVRACIVAWVNYDKDNRSELLPDLLRCIKLDSNLAEGANSVKSNFASEILTVNVPENRGKNVSTYYRTHRIPEYRVLLLHKMENGDNCIEWFDYKNKEFYELPLKWKNNRNSSTIILIDGRIFCLDINLASEFSKTAEIFDGDTFRWSPVEGFCIFDFAAEHIIQVGDYVCVMGSNIQCYNLRENRSYILNFDFDVRRYFNGDFFKTVVHGDLVYAFGQNKGFAFDSTNKSVKYINCRFSRYINAVCALNSFLYVFNGPTRVTQYDPEEDRWHRIADLNQHRLNPGVASIDGIMYAFGGDKGNTYECYDSRTNQWTLGDGCLSEWTSSYVVSTGAFVIGSEYIQKIKTGNVFQYYLDPLIRLVCTRKSKF